MRSWLPSVAGSALPWQTDLVLLYPEVLFIYKFRDHLNIPPLNYDYENQDHYGMKTVETWKKYKTDKNTMTESNTQFYVDSSYGCKKCACG